MKRIPARTARRRKQRVFIVATFCGSHGQASKPAVNGEKLPQVENLNPWPTTFFLNRRDLVRRLETGFPSSGSTEYYRDVKAAYVQTIETLLAER